MEQDPSVMTALAPETMLEAFLRLHRITVVALRAAIGEHRISRQTLDSMLSGAVHPRAATVAIVVRGLAMLVPRKRMSERALRRLASTRAPVTPEAQLREIDRALELRDDENGAA